MGQRVGGHALGQPNRMGHLLNRRFLWVMTMPGAREFHRAVAEARRRPFTTIPNQAFGAAATVGCGRMQGAETTRSQVSGASARMTNPNRVKSPCFAAISRIALLGLAVDISVACCLPPTAC